MALGFYDVMQQENQRLREDVDDLIQIVGALLQDLRNATDDIKSLEKSEVEHMRMIERLSARIAELQTGRFGGYMVGTPADPCLRTNAAPGRSLNDSHQCDMFRDIDDLK